jgi:hypothetical protein
MKSFLAEFIPIILVVLLGVGLLAFAIARAAQAACTYHGTYLVNFYPHNGTFTTYVARMIVNHRHDHITITTLEGRTIHLSGAMTIEEVSNVER